eukprot:358207-Chlamydomonas_euryale.AAC.2
MPLHCVSKCGRAQTPTDGRRDVVRREHERGVVCVVPQTLQHRCAGRVPFCNTRRGKGESMWS